MFTIHVVAIHPCHWLGRVLWDSSLLVGLPSILARQKINRLVHGVARIWWRPGWKLPDEGLQHETLFRKKSLIGHLSYEPSCGEPMDRHASSSKSARRFFWANRFTKKTSWRLKKPRSASKHGVSSDFAPFRRFGILKAAWENAAWILWSPDTSAKKGGGGGTYGCFQK